MGTVTIAANYGAGGTLVAPPSADRPRLPLIDRAIPVQLARELHRDGPVDERQAGAVGGRGRDQGAARTVVGRDRDRPHLLASYGSFARPPAIRVRVATFRLPSARGSMGDVRLL